MDDVPDFLHDRRRLLALVVALLVVLVLGGRVLRRSERPRVAAPLRVSTATPKTAPARIYVDVVGAVRRPGLYRVPDGARVADAVTRAGGPTPKAQLELVNLAARVADGEQIVVPRRGAVPVGLTGAAAEGGVPAGPVHLNSATLEQLDALPGVGPVTAQKIVTYRQQHGGFDSIDELDAVPGIGPARLEDLRGLVAP
jgi:competence protein ComEA